MRTTIANVKLILGTTALDDEALTLLIGDAGSIVDDNLVGHITDDDLLERIERWLSVHMVHSGPEPKTASEKAGPVAEAFQYKLGMDLKSTMAGQTALSLDHTGRLAKLGSPRKSVGMKTLGKV